jgi:hypothetical protein
MEPKSTHKTIIRVHDGWQAIIIIRIIIITKTQNEKI